MAKAGSALRKCREQAGVTQRQFARELGITPAYLCQVERGVRPVPRTFYGKLPREIRNQVIDAAILELSEEADELNAMR